MRLFACAHHLQMSIIMTGFDVRVKTAIESSSFSFSYCTCKKIHYLFSLRDTYASLTHRYCDRIRRWEEEEEEEEISVSLLPYINASASAHSFHIVCLWYFRSDLIGCMSFNMKTLLKTTADSKVRKSIRLMCEKPSSARRRDIFY